MYSVQIGAYRNHVTLKQLLGLSPIYYERLDHLVTKYLFGNFETLKEAIVAKDKMKALGIKMRIL